MIKKTPKNKAKVYADALDVLKGISRIRGEVDAAFQYKPEYYKAMSIRILDYLEKQRPDIFIN